MPTYSEENLSKLRPVSPFWTKVDGTKVPMTVEDLKEVEESQKRVRGIQELIEILKTKKVEKMAFFLQEEKKNVQ